MSTWNAPDEPGDEVTHVRDHMGVIWRRASGFWWADIGSTASAGDEHYSYEAHRSWSDLLKRGPLTDATGEAAA